MTDEQIKNEAIRLLLYHLQLTKRVEAYFDPSYVNRNYYQNKDNLLGVTRELERETEKFLGDTGQLGEARAKRTIHSTEEDRTESPIDIEVNPTQTIITQGDGACLEAIYMTPSQAAQLRAALGGDADLAAELKRQIATERNLYQAKLLSLENDKADLLAERDALKQCVLDYTEFAGHAAHCAAIESSREHECDCGFYQIMERHGDLIKRLIAERAEQIIAVITEHYQKP